MFTETLIVASWDKGRTTPAGAATGKRAATGQGPRCVGGAASHPSAGRAAVTHRTRGGYGF